jgi:hypothetical protein
MQPADRRGLLGTLFRVKRKKREVFQEAPPPPPPVPVRRPARVARMLALAHHIQGAIERRLVADRAAIARKLGLTRSLVTQMLDLLLLATDLQARVLELEAVDGPELLAERTLRAVGRVGKWAQQREYCTRLYPA